MNRPPYPAQPVPDPTFGPDELRSWLGEVDIYLFDQILKGRITPSMRLLDAGCGGGRNLRWLLRCGGRVHGVDRSREAVARARALEREIAPRPRPGAMLIGNVDALPYRDASFDAVLSSAVLHFAPDESSFEGMLLEMWRVLRPGGLLFARLASTIGIESRVERVEGRRFHLPDGTDRFLVDEAYLLGLGELLGGELVEPLKTTNVQNRRAMTTWVLRRGGGAAPEAAALEARRRMPELAPLLERAEGALYGAGGGEPPSEGWAQALEGASAGYPEDVGEEARRLGRALDGGVRGDEAKALLSALKTRVLVEDALRQG